MADDPEAAIEFPCVHDVRERAVDMFRKHVVRVVSERLALGDGWKPVLKVCLCMTSAKAKQNVGR